LLMNFKALQRANQLQNSCIFISFAGLIGYLSFDANAILSFSFIHLEQDGTDKWNIFYSHCNRNTVFDHEFEVWFSDMSQLHQIDSRSLHHNRIWSLTIGSMVLVEN